MASTDKSAFVASIAAQYGKRLRRFLSLRLRNASDVPDLAQEVFLRLLRVDHHDAIRNPEAYLLTVASHVLHQHAVLQAAIPPTVDISDLYAEFRTNIEESPEAQVALDQQLNELERALLQLPARESSALLMHRMAGYSIEEIGQKLGVARPTAKKYLAKALVHCRMGRNGTKDAT